MKFDDVRELRGLTQDPRFSRSELNVEGYPSEDFLALVRDVLPEQVTLVPDAENQRTSDHGWEVFKNRELLQPIVSDLSESGMRVALFVEPDVQDVRDAWRIGAHRIELYTEHYARAFDTGSFEGDVVEGVICHLCCCGGGLRPWARGQRGSRSESSKHRSLQGTNSTDRRSWYRSCIDSRRNSPRLPKCSICLLSGAALNANEVD